MASRFCLVRSHAIAPSDRSGTDKGLDRPGIAADRKKNKAGRYDTGTDVQMGPFPHALTPLYTGMTRGYVSSSTLASRLDARGPYAPRTFAGVLA